MEAENQEHHDSRIPSQPVHGQLAEPAESEQRFRSVVDHVVDGIITIDEQGIIQSVNPAAEKVFGYSSDSLVGQNVSVLMPEPNRSRHAAYVQNYLETGQAKIIGIGREVTGLRRDGTTFPMELGVSEFYLGAKRYFTGIVRDISERKRAECTSAFIADVSRSLASLVDTESTMQKIARLAVPFFADWCVVHMADQHGTLRQVAAAHADPARVELVEELGRRDPLDPGAAMGALHVFRTGARELRPEVSDCELLQAVQNEKRFAILQQLELRSCICVPLSVRERILGTISFALARSRRPYDVVDLAVAEDLAQRAAIAIENTRLYEQLREADRRKDEFLAMLAHELRNPLVPIRSGLDLLENARIETQTVQLMQQQVEHLVRLVDDLLDVSRIQRGKVELRREIHDLAAVVQRALEMAKPLIESQQHQLAVNLPPDPIWVEVDVIRLTQAILNLLSNAARYTEPGGHISVHVAREGASAVVRVRDTGIGIDRELLPHIFEPFIQGDPSLERSQGGLGIGLTLVRSLIEMHGGTVEAQSEGKGRGSEFILHLPVQSNVDSLPQTPIREQTTPRRRILVVDDNVSAARMLGMLLSRLGNHDVSIVHDGAAAIEAAMATRPEIVLLDIGLPRMNGYEVARRLRRESTLAGTVVVALTGYGTDSDRRRSLEAGFDEHLVKPPSAECLMRLANHPRLGSMP